MHPAVAPIDPQQQQQPPAADHWYYHDGKSICGPVPAHQLIDLLNLGILDANTPVAFQGWNAWKPASVAFAPQQGPVITNPEPIVDRSPEPMPSIPDIGPADEAIYQISAVRRRISQLSGLHVARGAGKALLSFTLFVAAFAAGYYAKEYAEANAREGPQTEQAERIVKVQEQYRKAGWESVPPFPATVREWARLKDIREKEQALHAANQRFTEAKRILERVATFNRSGSGVLPPAIAQLTLAQLTALDDEQFASKDREVAEAIQQAHRQQGNR